MISKISGIEVDEICGGELIFGKKAKIITYGDTKPYVELIKSDFINILSVFNLLEEPKAKEFCKKFDVFANVEDYDKAFAGEKFPAPLVYKKFENYVVIGIKMKADYINNGEIKIKELQQFENFRNLKRGCTKFVVCI